MLLHKTQSSIAILKRWFRNNQWRRPIIPRRTVFLHLPILSYVARTPDPANSTHQAIMLISKAKMLKTARMVNPDALQAHLTAHRNYLINVLLRAETLVSGQHRRANTIQELTPVAAIKRRKVNNTRSCVQPETPIFCRDGRVCISPSSPPTAGPGGMTGGGSKSCTAFRGRQHRARNSLIHIE